MGMKSEVKVGILVIIALCLATFLTFAVNDFSLFQKKFPINIIFTYVKGLTVGSPVKLSGVTVGEVKEIEILENVGKIRVGVELVEGTVVNSDSKARIETAGLMGEQYIELSFGQGSVLQPGATISGENPFRLEELAASGVGISEEFKLLLESLNDLFGDQNFQNSIQSVMTNLDGLTENLNSLLGGEKQNLSLMVANLVEASSKFNHSLSRIDQTVKKIDEVVENSSGDFQATIKNFKTISQELSEREGEILDNITQLTESLQKTSASAQTIMNDNQGNIKETLKNFKEASQAFKEAVVNIQSISKRVQDGEGALGKFIYDDEFETKVDETLEHYDHITKEVDRSFQSFELVGEYRYFSDDIHSDKSKERRWRSDLGLGFDVGEKNFIYLGANDIGVNNEFEGIFGRRFFNNKLALKAGVIESEAAIGGDYNPVEWAGITTEWIGLTDKDKSRVDIYGRVRPFSKLPWGWIVLGVDDIGGENFTNVGLRVEY